MNKFQTQTNIEDLCVDIESEVTVVLRMLGRLHRTVYEQCGEESALQVALISDNFRASLQELDKVDRGE